MYRHCNKYWMQPKEEKSEGFALVRGFRASVCADSHSIATRICIKICSLHGRQEAERRRGTRDQGPAIIFEAWSQWPTSFSEAPTPKYFTTFEIALPTGDQALSTWACGGMTCSNHAAGFLAGVLPLTLSAHSWDTWSTSLCLYTLWIVFKELMGFTVRMRIQVLSKIWTTQIMKTTNNPFLCHLDLLPQNWTGQREHSTKEANLCETKLCETICWAIWDSRTVGFSASLFLKIKQANTSKEALAKTGVVAQCLQSQALRRRDGGKSNRNSRSFLAA